MAISVAEMQQHWGELTQIFLSPDPPASWLLTVWVLVTPTELWVGGKQSGLSAKARSPHSSLAGDLFFLSHSVVIPGLRFGFPTPQRHSRHLVKGKSVWRLLKSMDERFPTCAISPLICHIPCTPPSHREAAQSCTFS